MLKESNSDMKCPFTLEHYREVLEIAKSNGYVFLGFHDPLPPKGGKAIYLRHDIDVCLEEALAMASLEAELGIRSTYFVLVNSPLYNPLAADSVELITQIQEKGHWIGLHFDPILLTSSDGDLLEKEVQTFLEFFRNRLGLVPVVSFHRPIPRVLGMNFQAFFSTYSGPFFSEIKYISDSRGIWREGCPCQALKEQTYVALQMLVHPIWWRQSESESPNERLYTLLGERLKRFKGYLAANIEPFANLLREEVSE